jgi:phenylacetate-CoA ligase
VPAEAFPRRHAIARRQVEQFHVLLRALVPNNRFYSAKFEHARAPSRIAHLGELSECFPFTTKEEIVADQAAHPPYGTNLTFPLERYTRCHQTSGTSGQPVRWLDTPDDWAWMLNHWEIVLRTADVTPADKIFFAFSFGPFLGFWTAFEAALRLGCLCLPGGGMSSIARVRALLDHGATVLCCTPTYALHLAEVAAVGRIDLSASQLRTIIVAGEPGGSVPAVRDRIRSRWPGTRVVDHHGMTEVGPVTFECPVRPCVLHIIESGYIAEVIDPAAGTEVVMGSVGELVLTTLGRVGSPLIRYRTGDLVRPATHSVCECGRGDLALEGGILGRADDMVVVRGVNVYPAAVEEIIRKIGGVTEYRVDVNTAPTLVELSIVVEPSPDASNPQSVARAVEDAMQVAFNLRVPVKAVPPGVLPRFELKAKRWVRKPGQSA